MPPAPDPRYTLLIPTYNRAASLRRLLAYLAARGFEYPVRVLDSSEPEALAANRQAIAQSPLNITHQVFDPSINPYAKFAIGVQGVETPYCSFCADDDVLFTATLSKYLDVLDNNSGLAAAHGYYVNFKPGNVYSISYTVYSVPSVMASDALQRVVQQMSEYQAVFYAIYRKPVLQSVLHDVQGMQTLLSLELLASSLTLVAGAVQRVPEFYMARNTNPSIATEGWHPHQFLAGDPSELFSEYAAYRDALLTRLMADAYCREYYGLDRMQRVLDLAHLKYLQPLLSPPILDYIIQETMRPDRTPRLITEGLWRTFVVPPESQRELPLGKRAAVKQLLVKILSTLWLQFRSKQFRYPMDMWMNRSTADGTPRRYVLFQEFLNQEIPGRGRISQTDIAAILEHFDDYR